MRSVRDEIVRLTLTESQTLLNVSVHVTACYLIPCWTKTYTVKLYLGIQDHYVCELSVSVIKYCNTFIHYVSQIFVYSPHLSLRVQMFRHSEGAMTSSSPQLPYTTPSPDWINQITQSTQTVIQLPVSSWYRWSCGDTFAVWLTVAVQKPLSWKDKKGDLSRQD